MNPETAKQFEDAMQLDLETVAREKGIKLTGKVITDPLAIAGSDDSKSGTKKP